MSLIFSHPTQRQKCYGYLQCLRTANLAALNICCGGSVCQLPIAVRDIYFLTSIILLRSTGHSMVVSAFNWYLHFALMVFFSLLLTCHCLTHFFFQNSWMIFCSYFYAHWHCKIVDIALSAPSKDTLISHNFFQISKVSHNQEFPRNAKRSQRQWVSWLFVTEGSFSLLDHLFGTGPKWNRGSNYLLSPSHDNFWICQATSPVFNDLQ